MALVMVEVLTFGMAIQLDLLRKAGIRTGELIQIMVYQFGVNQIIINLLDRITPLWHSAIGPMVVLDSGMIFMALI